MSVPAAAAAAEPVYNHTLVNHVSAAEDEEDGGEPNFFVMHSATSLFAGVPGHTGRADGDVPLHCTFHTPLDIVVDPRQQLFIADSGNSRIRRINKNGGRVSTVASISGGDGEVENRPAGLAFGLDGSLYILQTGKYHHIFSISPEGRVSQLAGNETIGGGHVDAKGSLYKAAFFEPRATGVDSKGRLYICEKGNSAVRRVDIAAKTVETLLDQRGQKLDLLHPEGIVVDQFDDIYVADTGHHRILKVTPKDLGGGVIINEVSNYAGVYGKAGYENGPVGEALLNAPTGLAVDKQNHLWICDTGNTCIRMMSYRSELMFTISGRLPDGTDAGTYTNPTSLALSYDAMYGAELAPTTPDEIAADPKHPLYYSYVTPIVFVSDAASHCIQKVHTILLEPANALIDVCNNEAGNDFPLHNALAYGDTSRRDELATILLKLKPHLLQQKDNDGRLPIHIAMLESTTLAAGSIALETISSMLRLSVGDSMAVMDKEGKTPLFYAMQQMSLHAFNEAEAGMPPATPEAPSAAMLYSRELIGALVVRQPALVTHPCCLGYTLHWYIYNQFPLEVLQAFVSAHSAARLAPGSGLNSAAAALPSPFLARDQHGRLPLHVAAMLHADAELDVIQWLVTEGRRALGAEKKSLDNEDPLRVRDNGVLHSARRTNPNTSARDVPVSGHHPLYYACTTPVVPPAPGGAGAASMPPAQRLRRAPLYGLDEQQQEIIEYLLREWPEAIEQVEGPLAAEADAMQGVLPAPEAKAAAALAAAYTARMGPLRPPSSSSSGAPSGPSFLEAVFQARATDLLSLLLRVSPAGPKMLDERLWVDKQPAPVSDEQKKKAKAARSKAKAQVARGGSAGAKAIHAAREPDLTQPNSLTMLQAAASINDLPTVEALLKAGANPFILDQHAQCLAVDLATDPKVVLLLRAHMEVDPRKPEDTVETATVETQTGPDSVLEAARQKLQETEEQLKAEQEKLERVQRETKEELEREVARLKDQEALIARQTAEEREAVRKRADAALAAKTAELLATQTRLEQEMEEEKTRLKQREADALKALAMRGDSEEAATRARLTEEYEAAKQALAARHADGVKRLEAEREAERAATERMLEAERRKLEQERVEKLGLLDAERRAQEARFAQLEEEHARAREAHAQAAQAHFAAQFEAAKDKMSCEYDERLAAQEQQMEEEVRVARTALETQKMQWEEELQAERERLAADFEARRKKLETDEAARVAAAAQQDSERRAAFEADKAERAAREVRDRVEHAKKHALNEKEQRRVDAERAAAFAKKEAELQAKWEAEQSALNEQRMRDQTAFLQHQTALLSEMDEHKARLEAEHAAHVAHEQQVLDELREAFETDKKAQIAAEMAREKARMQAAFDMDKAALQKIVDAERRHAEVRASEDAQRLAMQEVELERLRVELETQIRDKHAAQRQAHQRAMQVAKLEQSLETMQTAHQHAPVIRVTNNPLDVDPLLLGAAELPGVADSVAGFARSWINLSFRSLLALLLAMPYSAVPRAAQLLRLYFKTHEGAAQKVEESSGMLPLHMCAQAGLYRELTDIVLREHPLALRAEDRSGALSLFYAAAFREGREQVRAEVFRRNAESNGAKAAEAGLSPLAEDSYSVDTIRKQGLELIRYFMLKNPDSIYVPNKVFGAQQAALAASHTAATAAALPREAGAANTPSMALVPVKSLIAGAGGPASSPAEEEMDRAALALLSDAERDRRENVSMSVVEYAIEHSDLPLLNLLLELTSGDFLNACDARGLSYLHRAAGQGKLVLCQWLVEIGRINPWTLCHADRTALEYVPPAGNEALALYLTREMAKVAPEQRIKARRGAKRMLIREWAHQSGADPDDDEGPSYLGGSGGAAARAIGGRDAFRPFAPYDGSPIDPATLTPRGASSLMRARANGGRPGESPPPAGAGPHTTHIHVYGDAARSLLAGKSLKRLSDSGASPLSDGDLADFASTSISSPSASANGSAFRKSRAHTYHWEFLPERPKNATLTLVGASSPLSAAASASSSRKARHQSSPSPPRMRHSYSEQALDERPSSSLQQQLAELSSPGYAASTPAGSPLRYSRR